jgi:hypothetical protein
MAAAEDDASVKSNDADNDNSLCEEDLMSKSNESIDNI